MFVGSNLIRRVCVEAVGGFDTNIHYMEHWAFYLRLAQAGFTYACSRQAVMLYRNHPDNRFRDSAPMLQDHLTILNRIFADSAWQSRLTGVRDRAYYLAYFGNVLANFAYGNPDQGAQSLNMALGYAPMTPRDLTRLAGCIAQRVMDMHVEAPPDVVPAIFAAVRQTTQTRLLQNKVMALVHMSLAFQEHRSGDLRMASRHALVAIRHDLSMWHNRGLMRVLIDGTGGRDVLDWVRSRRQRLVGDLARRIADRPCIFISPHFDDVVLSCGGTLAQLSQQQTNTVLVTVFTADQADGAPLSPLAQQMHEVWGSVQKPFETRKNEDRATTEYLSIEYLWLEFQEVIYRYQTLKKGEILHPTFNPRGDACFKPVRAALLRVLDEHPHAVVFAPLGLGYHRDHLIVHEAVKDVAQMATTSCALIFYEDYPYAATADLNRRLDEVALKLEPLAVDVSATLSERVRLAQMHTSQMSMLFGDAANAEKEIRAYANWVGTNSKPCERFWCSRNELDHHDN